MRRFAIGVFLLATASACGPGDGAGKPGEQPTPPPESLASDAFKVESGYAGLPWGASRSDVQKKLPDAKPSAKNPDVLVRTDKIADWPMTEAYFFGERGLDEVEIKIEPKRSPQEAAALAISLDRKFRGTHETSLADDHMYQLAWFGEDTDVRLTYDLRESMAWGPVINYSVRTTARATPVPSAGVSTPVASGAPGKQLSAGIRNARKAGLSLTSAAAEPGRLTLIYGDATKALELIVTSEPKTGNILGYVELARSPKKGTQRGAEAVIDNELKKSDVTKIVFGGKAGFEHLITVWFGSRFVTLDPKAPDLLAGGSYAKPTE